MGKLKESITKAQMNGANEDLVKEGTKVHDKLTGELELSRAKDSYPTVKLPVEEMEAKEAKAHWIEDDPENPVNIGALEQTREWPLPPEDTGEYVWNPSPAFKSLAEAHERLETALTFATSSGANDDLLATAKAVLAEKAKEVDLLKAKDEGDKETQVAAAAKLAKKLKKGKGGKKKA